MKARVPPTSAFLTARGLGVCYRLIIMSASVAGFSFPTATIFGAGAIGELPTRLKQMGSRRPLVVTDPGLLQTQAFNILKTTLGSQDLGNTWELFHGVHS